MKHIYVLLLSIMLTSLNAQSWQLTEDLQGFITDIEFDGDTRYVTFKTGELFRNDTLIATYPVQTTFECGLHSVLRWGERLCVCLSSPDSKQRVICDSDTLLEVSYTAPLSARHRGGDMLLHPSGILLVSLGYGGNPIHAQDTSDYRGKIIAITDTSTYIYTLGLRNGWKMDIKGDTLYIADAGDHAMEEIDRIDTSGLNLGWPCTEGTIVHDTTCGVTMGPLYTYPRDKTGICIIGGKYFRGAYWWCDNFYEFGGYTYDDSTNVKIPCPQYPVGMYVHGDTIFAYDYTGKIYRWEEAPLSIDTLEDEQGKPRPSWEEEAYNRYVERMIVLYGGDLYLTMDRKIVSGLPTVPGYYWSLIRRKGYAVISTY